MGINRHVPRRFWISTSHNLGFLVLKYRLYMIILAKDTFIRFALCFWWVNEVHSNVKKSSERYPLWTASRLNLLNQHASFMKSSSSFLWAKMPPLNSKMAETMHLLNMFLNYLDNALWYFLMLLSWQSIEKWHLSTISCSSLLGIQHCMLGVCIVHSWRHLLAISCWLLVFFSVSIGSKIDST